MSTSQNGLKNNPQNKSLVDNLICKPWGLLGIVGLVIARS
jgi:hypothetical protein